MRRGRPGGWVPLVVAAVASAGGCMEVEVPGGATLLDVGPDWLLMPERSTLGVEHVAIHPFERTRGGEG